ncbi:MAG: hypothetical protein MUD06_01110, partial [Rhodospirillales bacterium]|nr:hypothetical protein [Rhodospirillales bacterium]
MAAAAALVAATAMAPAAKAGGLSIAEPQAVGGGVVKAATGSLTCRPPASPITFTVQKRWFASATTADYSFYSPPNSEFV